MIITRHAVERFVRRHAPEMPEHAARIVLRDAARAATRLRERTWRGHTIWSVAEPRIRLVTKIDREMGLVCVTVLPRETASIPEDELALLREAALAAAPAPVVAMPAEPASARVTLFSNSVIAAERRRRREGMPPSERRCVECGRGVQRSGGDLVWQHAGPDGICPGTGSRWSKLPELVSAELAPELADAARHASDRAG